MRAWETAKRYAFDVFVVVGAIEGIVEVLLTRGDEDSVDGSLWVLITTVLVMTLPLLARRVWPFGAPASITVAAGAISFLEGQAVPYLFVTFLAVVSASFLFGMLRDRVQAVIGLGLVWMVGAVVTYNDPGSDDLDQFFTLIVFGAAWLAGLALSRRLDEARQAEERASKLEEDARRAVDAERARIARELHDVIAHSVSVMTVQAGAVRRLLTPEQTRERQALETVESTGREALTEMRRLVGLLREQGTMPEFSPQPGLKSLDTLLGTVREAGLPVDLHVEGKPRELAAGVDLSAYRVVQEALTNALKYAGPARAWVTIRWRDDELELEISNDGRVGDGGGHGLVGLRERVSLVGGSIESGPREGGGFVVKAHLPLGERT